MKYLIRLLVVLLIQSPTFAGNGTTPVIIFRNHAASTNEIVCTASSNIHSPDDCYDFVPTNGDMNASHYSNNYPQPGYAFSYVPPAPPPPGPDVQGFLTAVQQDILITNNPLLLFQLGGSVLPIFQVDATVMAVTHNPIALQQHWSKAIQAFGSTWLTSQVQTMILSYASTYRIPLVP